MSDDGRRPKNSGGQRHRAFDVVAEQVFATLLHLGVKHREARVLQPVRDASTLRTTPDA